MLHTLLLSSNLLTDVPPSLAALHSLAVLALRNNLGLMQIPDSVIDLPRLERLELQSNNLSSPPQHVADEGLAALRRYTRKSRLASAAARLDVELSGARLVSRWPSSFTIYDIRVRLRGEVAQPVPLRPDRQLELFDGSGRTARLELDDADTTVVPLQRSSVSLVPRGSVARRFSEFDRLARTVEEAHEVGLDRSRSAATKVRAQMPPRRWRKNSAQVVQQRCKAFQELLDGLIREAAQSESCQAALLEFLELDSLNQIKS